jgi:hypothetical protein
MRRGDYVLFDNIAWQVWLKHADGSFQIKCLQPDLTWVDNTQVKPEDCTPITKEVADIMRAV